MPKAKASIPKVTWGRRTHSWTWSNIVHHTLSAFRGTASLAELYSTIERHPRTKKRKHWKAKVRQTLEQSDEYVRVDRGVWSFLSGHSAKKIKKLKRLRRKLYPKRTE